MTPHHTAQGLASLGRHGDSMLVHMSPHEVAGLNYLAKKQGTKLTVNPDTGLPEAFSLGGLFSSILPMFAGAMFPGAGFAMEPLLAGALTGGVLAGVKGENPLMGGLMGGLGGMSGSNLAFGLQGAAGAGQGALKGVGPEAFATEGASNMGNIGMANTFNTGAGATLGQAGTYSQALNPTQYTGAQGMMDNPVVRNAVQATQQAGGILPNTGSFMDKELTSLSNAGAGAGNLITGKPGAFEGFKNAFAVDGAAPLTNFQAATKIGMPIGGALLGGLEPSDLYGDPINMDEAKKKEAYDPYRSLNLSNDTGLRLVAEGGYIDGYAVGGTVTTGGLRDLYATTDSSSNPQLSRDGYGVGRLENLARQQAMTQAQTTGYAMGGPVSFADGGDTMKLQDDLTPVDQGMGLTSLMPPATMPPAPGQTMPTDSVQNAASALSNTASSDSSIIAQVANNLRTDPNYQPKNPIEAAIAKQIKGTDQTQQSQGLGSLGAQPSQPMAPTFNPSQAMGPTYFAGMNAPRGFADGGGIEAGGGGEHLNLDQLPSLNLNTGSTNPGLTAIITQSNMRRNPFANMMNESAFNNYNRPNVFNNAGVNFASDNRDGLSFRNIGGSRMAHGGYLDGQGDGMSDSIPATIEGQQPARLADGEFVVPADVVSHLGNGSSKAGSKRLYAMLDKVRHARTGNKKQGKEIKPEKYMPA